MLNFVTGISPDGTVVVGTSNSTDGRQAYRWSEAGGIVGLGDLARGTYFSQASDASADGSVVIGVSTSASGQEAFIWQQNKASMSGLGDLAEGAFSSWAETELHALGRHEWIEPSTMANAEEIALKTDLN